MALAPVAFSVSRGGRAGGREAFPLAAIRPDLCVGAAPLLPFLAAAGDEATKTTTRRARARLARAPTRWRGSGSVCARPSIEHRLTGAARGRATRTERARAARAFRPPFPEQGRGSPGSAHPPGSERAVSARVSVTCLVKRARGCRSKGRAGASRAKLGVSLFSLLLSPDTSKTRVSPRTHRLSARARGRWILLVAIVRLRVWGMAGSKEVAPRFLSPLLRRSNDDEANVEASAQRSREGKSRGGGIGQASTRMCLLQLLILYQTAALSMS